MKLRNDWCRQDSEDDATKLRRRRCRHGNPAGDAQRRGSYIRRCRRGTVSAVVGWSLKIAVSPGAAEGKKVGVSKTPMASEGARAYNGDLGAYSHSGGPRGRALTLTSENWPRTSKLLQTAVILPTDSSLRYTSMRTLRAYCGRNVCWRSRNVQSVGERPGAKRRDRSGLSTKLGLIENAQLMAESKRKTTSLLGWLVSVRI